MAVMTDRCIFCGEKAKLTGEHSFWSNWTRAYFPSAPKETHRRTVIKTSKKNPRIFGVHRTKNHHGSMTSIKFKVVCERTCNNGWMRELENAVKPILTPIMLGQPTALSQPRQEILARWIAMKCMVAEFSTPADVSTTPEDRLALMNGAVPPDWAIYLGMFDGPEHRFAYRRDSGRAGYKPVDGPPRPFTNQSKNMHSISVAMGRLLIWVVGSSVRGFKFKPSNGTTRRLHQIYPFHRGFLWPPGAVLDDATAQVIATTFQRTTQRMKWVPDND